MCKHLVQAAKPVPPQFFLQVKQHCTLPFWTHSALRPLVEGPKLAEPTLNHGINIQSPVPDVFEEDLPEEEEEEDLVDSSFEVRCQSFEQQMRTWILMLRNFLDGMDHQIQFQDH